jgi:hypothetical protein
MPATPLRFPSPDADDCRPLMLAAYKSIISDQNVIYCSGPITSGRLAIVWFQNHPSQPHDIDALPRDLRRDFDKTVVDENTNQLKLLASSIRNKTGKLVIDPSVLTEGNWKQEHWREFWCEVISQFAEAVVLAPEWEFSKGTCSECLFALQNGIPVRLHDGSNVNLQRATEDIRLAMNETQACGFSIEFFENLLSKVDDLQQG